MCNMTYYHIWVIYYIYIHAYIHICYIHHLCQTDAEICRSTLLYTSWQRRSCWHCDPFVSREDCGFDVKMMKHGPHSSTATSFWSNSIGSGLGGRLLTSRSFQRWNNVIGGAWRRHCKKAALSVFVRMLCKGVLGSQTSWITVHDQYDLHLVILFYNNLLSQVGRLEARSASCKRWDTFSATKVCQRSVSAPLHTKIWVCLKIGQKGIPKSGG